MTTLWAVFDKNDDIQVASVRHSRAEAINAFVKDQAIVVVWNHWVNDQGFTCKRFVVGDLPLDMAEAS